MPPSDRLLAGLDLVRGVVAGLGPDWLADLREAGFRTYAESGVPTTRDEEFRYFPVAELNEVAWKPAYGAHVEREQLADALLKDVAGPTLTFVNGQSAPDLMTPSQLPEGVYVGSLEDLPEGIDVKPYLGQIATLRGKLGSTNDERFKALNDAHLAEVAVVYVPKGVEVEDLILVRHLVSANEGPMALYPRTLIVLEENARAKVCESYETLGGLALDIPVTEVSLAQDAALEHARLVLEAPDSIHIANVSVRQERGSVYDAVGFNFEGLKVRNDINADVVGEHAETWLNGVNVGEGRQILDNHTRIDHAVPNCRSFEIYKTILRDESVGVFNGKIFVYEDAQKTDAKQTNQALLLSPRATMNTKPQLEIFADDVKCTHGATIGQLREEALFYLRARGIPKAQAQALLVYAFAAEVIERISTDALRETLERALYAKLGAA